MTTPIAALLTSFGRVNAVAMLAAGALAFALRAPWLFAALGLVPFVALVAVCRGRHTPTGAFGLANALTTLRLLLASSFGFAAPVVPAWGLGCLVLVVFALDGLDGWVALRRGESSEFGAHFDMETDAYFVLLIGLTLYLGGRYGPWIVGVGLLRYLYVLCLSVVPARGHVPRGSHGRHAFTALMLGLSLGLLVGEPWATVVTALGCGLVTASFAYSFYWSYARRAPN